ncbi:hypothetical protein TruAng_010364 [Truncatella angustata]|nr:hypothetical protein TruAng_010364 [Truncatella angustata]
MAAEITDIANPTHLEPSELGTKEYHIGGKEGWLPSPSPSPTTSVNSLFSPNDHYSCSWDELYTREISNHTSNPSDTGTNWFDDSGAQDKVLQFLSEHFSSTEEQADPGHARSQTSFLDLGTGNGELLFGLRDEGWAGRMLGVDYSEKSVQFARRINDTRQERFGGDQDEDEDEGEDEPTPSREPVEFAQHDILSARGASAAAILSGAQSRGWDVVLDKGTFDAISLSSATDGLGRRINEGYRAAALGLVREGGLFLITSCNWTEDELEKWFAGKSDEGGEVHGRFEVEHRIEYRSFSFGGVKGQTISSVCFRKVGR